MPDSFMASGATTAGAAPAISVIVPTYNYGRFIGGAIESLRAQTRPDWECVVVDDGSTDDTAEVVAGFAARDPRVRLLRQENRRQAAARNNGLRHSSGRYVQFLDADDLIEPRKLELQAEHLERHPGAGIVYGDARFFPTEDPGARLHTMYGEDRPWQPGLSGEGAEVLLPLLRHNSVMIGATLVRREVVERVGAFDEELPAIEDWHYWLRCAAAGVRFDYRDAPGTLSLIRSHPVSWSKDERRNAAAEVLMRRKLRRALADGRARRLNEELLAEAEGTWGAEEVMGGSLARGVYQLCRAAALDRNARHRLKWLGCALAAPFAGRRGFEKVYRSSVTGLAAAALKSLQPDGRR